MDSSNEIDILDLKLPPLSTIILNRTREERGRELVQDTKKECPKYVVPYSMEWRQLTQQQNMEAGTHRMRVKMIVKPTIFSSINKTVNNNKQQTKNYDYKSVHSTK